MGNINDNDICNSRIGNSSFNGGSLHGSDIFSRYISKYML